MLCDGAAAISERKRTATCHVSRVKKGRNAIFTRLLFWWRRIRLPGMDVGGCRWLPRRNVLIAGSGSGSGTCLLRWCQGGRTEAEQTGVRNGRTFFSPSRRGGPSEAGAGAGDWDDVELASRASVHRSSNREIVQICFPPTRTLSTPSPISDFTASLIDRAFLFHFYCPALQ